MAEKYVVEMCSISKSFGGTHALSSVDLHLKSGEVRGLIGENGAGKSTLIKILAGAYQKDSGKVLVDGEEIISITPHVMLDLGISVIYQEFMLAPDLSVLENIFIKNLQRRRPYIDWKLLETQATELLQSIGFGYINPKAIVRDLSIAEQQVVEICKAIARDSKVIVFDEPTAVLTTSETRKLLALIEKLSSSGVSVLFVSHRLNELFEICDSITVLKDGHLVRTVTTEEVSESELVYLMVGRELTQMFPERQRTLGDEVIRGEGLAAGSRVRNASFHAHAGEVVGFAGLVGSGRTELMRILFGADRATEGEIFFAGQPIKIRSPQAAIDLGIGLVPEDRKVQGLALDQSIRFNAGMVFHTGDGYISPRKDTRFASELLARFATKYRSLADPVSSLSGGNQQKVSLAKWLANDLKVVILDEPTRGVDVGAKSEIYKIVEKLASDGYAVLVVSSELPEIIGLCDRVYVMREGETVGMLSGTDISEDRIIEYVMGVRSEKVT